MVVGVRMTQSVWPVRERIVKMNSTVPFEETLEQAVGLEQVVEEEAEVLGDSIEGAGQC